MAIDYQALFGGETYDPCAALQALRPAYMKMRVEGGVQSVSFRDRKVEMGKGDLESFGALIAELEAQCAERTGGPRRRFAITAGARRV